MNKIHMKLNSNKGSSLILVLGLFLICIMVSSVVVATATVGASRSAYRQQQQRAYLSLSSAVELVANDMDTVLRNNFSEKIRVLEYGCNDATLDEGEAFLEENKTVIIDEEEITYQGIKLHADVTSHNEISGTTSGLLGAVVLTACQEIYSGDYSYEEDFWIYPQNSDERFTRVYCKFAMAADYSITLTFSAEDSSQTVTMEYVASEENKAPEEEVFYCTHNIIYDDNVTVRSRQYPGKEIYYATEIKWGSPTVKRGAE